MRFSVRPYQKNSNDLAALVALVEECWQPKRLPFANYHIGDLYWRLRHTNYQNYLFLWEDDAGRLAGFAEWANQNLDAQVHPRYVNGDRILEAHMIAWAQNSVETGAVIVYANKADAGYVVLLEAQGFVRIDEWTNYHMCHLASSLAAPVLSPGYAVRSLTTNDTLDARIKAHRAGFESAAMTLEVYQRLRAMPGYNQELDLVVVAPDGTFAATANCWVDQKNRVGLFAPVSVVPAHRRKGVGHALVTFGLQ